MTVAQLQPSLANVSWRAFMIGERSTNQFINNVESFERNGVIRDAHRTSISCFGSRSLYCRERYRGGR